MIPTFVFGWPQGTETGNYLAVDLGEQIHIYHLWSFAHDTVLFTGGTNLRVCLVTLQGSGKFEITQSKYRLTEEQKHEDGQLVFDFCAECLKKFIDSSIESGVIPSGVVLPLGFTVRLLHSELCQSPMWIFAPCSSRTPARKSTVSLLLTLSNKPGILGKIRLITVR